MSVKQWIFGWIIFAITLGACADELRTFNDSKGREIKAFLLDFKPSTGSVKLRLENKSIKSVKLSIFSELDQEYIHAWKKVKSAFNGRKLTLSADKKTLDSGLKKIAVVEGKDTYIDMQYDDIAYKLTLRNRTGQIIENLFIEYRIYIKSSVNESLFDIEIVDGWPNETAEKKDQRTETRFIQGAWHILKLKPSEQLTKMTEEIQVQSGLVESKRLQHGTQHFRKTVRDKLLGLRTRLYLPLPGEKKAMKEYAFPSILSTKIEWNPSIPQSKLRIGDTSRQKKISMRGLAHDYRDKKEYDKAIEIFKKLYRSEKRGYDAYEVGSIYLWEHPNRSYEKARPWLDFAIGKKFARAQWSLSRYYALGYDPSAWDSQKAVYHAELAVEFDSDCVDLLAWLATSYAKNSQFKDAVRIQEKAIQLAETKPRYLGKWKIGLKEDLKLYQSGLPY